MRLRKPALILLAFLISTGVILSQSETTLGELKRLTRLWDGTDIALVDGSGNLMVGDGTGALTIDGTVTVTDGSGSLTVDGTITANAGSGTFTVGDGSGALTVDGTVTVTDGAGALNVIVDSGALTATVTDGSGALNTIVDSGTITANAGTGTFTVGDGSGALNVIVDSGALTVSDGSGALNVIVDSGIISGDIAHDSADSGNPLKTGGIATSYGTAQTAVAANDRVNSSFDRNGVPFVQPYHPNTSTIEYMWTTAQTDDALVTVSAGTRIGVTGFQVTLDEATTVGVGIRCGFGTSTLSTAPTDGNTATGIFLHHAGIVPGGGINSPPGLLLVGADNEDLRCTTEATTSGTGKIVVSYFTTAN